jgi:hypothetical protein
MSAAEPASADWTSPWYEPGAANGHAAQLESLTRINTAELLEALGLTRRSPLWSIAERLCRPAARRIARQLADCDAILAARGLQEGALEILPQLVGRFEVSLAATIPDRGPVLIVSNHPGLCDVLAIFAVLGRRDLKIVAADYPLLQALPGVRPHLLFVPRAASARRGILWQLIDHLRQGGALLLLPAGRIEPDPVALPAALRSLETWSESLGLLVRRVHDVRVVPAVVSGVLDSTMRRHPLTWLRRQPADRQRLATTLQVLAGTRPGVTARLAVAHPIARADLVGDDRPARAVTRLVVDSVRELMLSPSNVWTPIERPSAEARMNVPDNGGL